MSHTTTKGISYSFQKLDIDTLQLFTKAEVAERLNVSVRTVDRLVADGELTTFRPGRHGRKVHITAHSLAEYIYGNGGELCTA